jgi:site-specific DNA-methyltransferase (adenine-specific)
MLDKGKNRKLNDLSVSDIIPFKRIAGKQKLVPTQKPVELFRLLIEQSSNEGELVLDPFMGFGTTGIACTQTKRNFIGCDINPEYVKKANEYIEQIKKTQQMNLFSY